MRELKRSVAVIALIMIWAISFAGCEPVTSIPTNTSKQDAKNTLAVGDKLANNQATPTDIDYSLERYNLIRRAYWVNGQREKARSIPQPLADIPLGYCVLLTESGAVVGNYIVDGKVTSLNSYLSPDSEYYEKQMGESNVESRSNKWLPDVDGSYGENDNGIFFFTPDGKYIEWTGIYLYSDIPFEVENPILKVGGGQ